MRRVLYEDNRGGGGCGVNNAAIGALSTVVLLKPRARLLGCALLLVVSGPRQISDYPTVAGNFPIAPNVNAAVNFLEPHEGELRRIPLPRTKRLNKGMNKGQSYTTPLPFHRDTVS